MKQRGFTLVELILVIVIFGILPVTTVPRLLTYQRDTYNATLQDALRHSDKHECGSPAIILPDSTAKSGWMFNIWRVSQAPDS